jgi:iron complex outermembrane recepter protein
MKDVMAHLIKKPSIVLASLLALGQAYAQTLTPTITALEPVVVKASSTPASEMLSIGDVPLSATPLSATVISSQQIQAAGAKRLADLNKMDASVSDAYNTVGYWDYATVRGFVIDNKYNYRREGLPISAETAIGLDNKASVEVLKGTSGMQAGTSAPGGLVNYLVKRPTNQDLRSVRLEANSNGSFGAAADLGGRFGANKEFGYRINAAADQLDSYAAATQGNRQLLAVAGDWRINADSLLQAEIEYSHRAQRSVPGLSLLGNALPSPDAKLNINSQAWSQPVVLDGLTGSIKFDQAISNDWRWTAQLGKQQLTSQDRVAFPYGCYDSGSGTYYADRYCPDGSYDLYDFRSDNERRSTTAAQVQLKGQVEAGGVKHGLAFGLLSSRVKDRFEMQAYNYSGTGSIYSSTALPADASLNDQNTHRTERSTELSVSDMAQWNSKLTTWAGLRYTQQQRASVRTDGSRATDYSASFAAPWLAASYKIAPSTMAYASYGQGVETEVAPNRSRFANAGQALPSLKSSQYELGVKALVAQTQLTAAVFDISRPMFGDAGTCSASNSCTRQLDGTASHRGVELTAATAVASRQQPWHIDGGITAIQAKREGSSIDPTVNGMRPINVPSWIARLNGEYLVSAVPGLAVQAHVSHEGRRAVLADNSINLPAWTRLDLGVRYDTRLASTQTTWKLGIDNVLNQRYFNESPNQFSHVYLFTAAPRTVRLALQVTY